MFDTKTFIFIVILNLYNYVESYNDKPIKVEVEEFELAIQDLIKRIEETDLIALPSINQLVNMFRKITSVLLTIRVKNKKDKSNASLKKFFTDLKNNQATTISKAVGQTFLRLEVADPKKAQTFKFVLFEGGQTRSRFQELLLKGDIISAYSTGFRIIFEKIQSLPYGGYSPIPKT